MKIAFVTSYPAIDVLPAEQVRKKYHGNEHNVPWVRLLADALSKKDGVELRIFVYGRAARQHSVVEKDGVVFEFVPKRVPARFEPYHMYLPSRRDLLPYIGKYKPDVVVGFGTETGNAQISTMLPFPSVIFIQGILDKLDPYMGSNCIKSIVGKRTERAALKRATGVIVESKFAESWVVENKDDVKVQVIPHPLDSDFLDVKSSCVEPNLLCVGKMYSVKGTDIVIRAFAKCKNVSSRLRLIGHGDDREYMELAKSLGVSGRVDFVGRVGSDIVREEMSKGSVMVIGSRMDTSPNVVTEAHAAGLPVIGTRAGGIPEMINDGEDGFLVPVDDVGAMSEKMNILVSDSELCRKMGERGKEKVRVLNDASSIAEAHISFYSRIISNE